MKSGETAGQGNGHLCVPTARKRSAQARSWKPGRRRQPSGARERWKPVRGETPQTARCEARQRDRPCFLAGDAHAVVEMQRGSSVVDKQPLRHWYCRSGAAGSAASRGAKHRAAGIARRAFPWRQAKRAAPQARRSRQRAQQKKRCAAPAGTTHRKQRGAISSPPAPSSTATARSRPAQRTRKPARPRSAR